MIRRSLAALLACAVPSAAAPTEGELALTYGNGEFSASKVDLLVVRAEISHEVERLRLRTSMSFVRASSTNEGETDVDTGWSNPTLHARYELLAREALSLGVSTGVIAVFDHDRDPAKAVGGSFTAMRYPYELARTSAVPLIVDLELSRGGWKLDARAGAYFVSGDGLVLDEAHVAFGGAFGLADDIAIRARVHGLFVRALADSPAQYEPMARAYFGLEASVAFRLHPTTHVHAGLWKPFGYDNSEPGNGMTALTVGGEVGF